MWRPFSQIFLRVEAEQQSSFFSENATAFHECRQGIFPKVQCIHATDFGEFPIRERERFDITNANVQECVPECDVPVVVLQPGPYRANGRCRRRNCIDALPGFVPVNLRRQNPLQEFDPAVAGKAGPKSACSSARLLSLANVQ